MKIVVALGGEIADSGLLRARVAGAELTIAADRGALQLEQVGLSPDLVIGDFDSLSEAALARLRRRGVEIVAHPNPQQQTDGHVALQLAAERGASEVVLLGAAGRERLDHQLTNLLFLVAQEFAALPISAVSFWTEAVGLHGRETGFGRAEVRFAGEPGDYVSLVALEPLRGVTSDGLRWPLEGAELELGLPGAISNELTGEAGGFRIETGRAIATHTFRQERLPNS